MKKFICLTGIFLAAFFNCSLSLAQVPEAPDIPDLPEGVVLPEVSAGSGTAKLINSANVGQYRAIIIPELYQLLRSDTLQMEAARRIQYAWRFDDEWEKDSQNPYAGGLTAGGFPQPGDIYRRWFVFGNAGLINRESDARVQGQKILWNINSVWWSQKILKFDFDLYKPALDRLESKLSGSFLRVYPHMLDAADKTDQLFAK